MTAREAYQVLQAKREKYKPNMAFYKAAEELGMTPKALARFFTEERRRKREEEEGEQQLSLFA